MLLRTPTHPQVGILFTLILQLLLLLLLSTSSCRLFVASLCCVCLARQPNTADLFFSRGVGQGAKEVGADAIRILTIPTIPMMTTTTMTAMTAMTATWVAAAVVGPLLAVKGECPGQQPSTSRTRTH